MATTKQAQRARQRATARAERNDYEIMRARTLATGRGAIPAEIERNVRKIETRTTWDKEPRQLGARDWDRGVSLADFARGEL